MYQILLYGDGRLSRDPNPDARYNLMEWESPEAWRIARIEMIRYHYQIRVKIDGREWERANERTIGLLVTLGENYDTML